MTRMPTALAAKTLIADSGVVDRPLVLLDRDGSVARMSTSLEEAAPHGTLHLPQSTLCPGFLDVHVHGAGGRDVMEGTPEAIGTVSRMLALHGTTRYLATTVTASVEHTLRALSRIADAVEQSPAAGEADVVGIHLEGPFLSHAKRGVHEPEFLQRPSVSLFDQFFEAARGHICLVTIAPEEPGALELIGHATARGVRVSLGHSDALAQQARAGIAAGARSATHTFNAMRNLTQREPGLLGVVLDSDDLFAELICDGVHTTPEAVRLWLRMKGHDRAMLVTDGMAATGMPDGDYLLGSMLAQVKDGVAMHNGVLAGSVLTMDRAVANVQSFTQCSLAVAVRLASTNPAAMLGSALQASTAADFNIYNEHGQRTGTIVRGKPVTH